MREYGARAGSNTDEDHEVRSHVNCHQKEKEIPGSCAPKTDAGIVKKGNMMNYATILQIKIQDSTAW